VVVKVQEIQPKVQEIPVNINGLTVDSQPLEQKVLTFDLARSRGTARFRIPTVRDMRNTEQVLGKLASNNFSPDFCRQLARSCCESWGNLSTIPAAEEIRRIDDDSLVLLFINYLNTEDSLESYGQALEGESSRADGFDAYEVTLSDGTKLVFDEPTQKDNQQKEKAKTTTDGMVRFASALCRRWNSEPITWTLALQRFEGMVLSDFFRVANTLNNFR
jgi:hypothetical protein